MYTLTFMFNYKESVQFPVQTVNQHSILYPFSAYEFKKKNYSLSSVQSSLNYHPTVGNPVIWLKQVKDIGSP